MQPVFFKSPSTYFCFAKLHLLQYNSLIVLIHLFCQSLVANRSPPASSSLQLAVVCLHQRLPVLLSTSITARELISSPFRAFEAIHSRICRYGRLFSAFRNIAAISGYYFMPRTIGFDQMFVKRKMIKALPE